MAKLLSSLLITIICFVLISGCLAGVTRPVCHVSVGETCPPPPPGSDGSGCEATCKGRIGNRLIRAICGATLFPDGHQTHFCSCFHWCN
ncbi:hypothetical protein CASFOL_035987 [Castilleja foliolosa]|uniref:Uncharacterized protein n=1 Tax=Castilleja foliolosa TaxID=1961234 RepID=A0ABD3BUA3_9LAMI